MQNDFVWALESRKKKNLIQLTFFKQSYDFKQFLVF